MSRSTAATRGPQVDDWWGEPGSDAGRARLCLPTRSTSWPSLTGTPGRPVNAIPPKAVANCQLRFVAGTEVDDVDARRWSAISKAKGSPRSR